MMIEKFPLLITFSIVFHYTHVQDNMLLWSHNTAYAFFFYYMSNNLIWNSVHLSSHNATMMGVNVPARESYANNL